MQLKLPFRLPKHIIASADEVDDPALCRLWICCDHCGGEEDWLVATDAELRWTAGRFLDRHFACQPEKPAAPNAADFARHPQADKPE